VSGPVSDIRQILVIVQSINAKVGVILTALADLQAADQALKDEVAAFLADIAAALSGADPQVESVVSDINAQIAALKAADPAAPPPPPSP
jgi:outer membrane murein-binding lipoprotein Lpp